MKSKPREIIATLLFAAHSMANEEETRRIVFFTARSLAQPHSVHQGLPALGERQKITFFSYLEWASQKIVAARISEPNNHPLL